MIGKFTLYLLSMLAVGVVYAQRNPHDLLNDVRERMAKVDDYTVDADIDADIPLIRILPVKAKIYFKKDDKFKVESKSIAILPKQSYNDLSSLIKQQGGYDAFMTGKEQIGAVNATIINVIPASDTSDLILAKLWIDEERDLIMRSQLTTRSSGTMLIDYMYGAHAKLALPEMITFTVDVKKFKIPKGVATDINRSTSATDEKEKQRKNGKITIRFSNYLINSGLKDAFFDK